MDISRIFMIGHRIGDAPVSYLSYLWKMLFPCHLAFPYPNRSPFPLWQVISAALILAVITGWIIAHQKKYKYLFTGWFWYIITLLPVMGITNTAPYKVTDRYTYIPFIGIFIIVAWGGWDLFKKSKRPKTLSGLLAGILLFLFAVISWNQTGYWKNDIRLLTHADEVTHHNDLAQGNLGYFFAQQGNPHDAITYYEKAMKTNPNWSWLHHHLGKALVKVGEKKEAIIHFKKAVELRPLWIEPRLAWANTCMTMGRYWDSLALYRQILRLQPGDARIYNNLGVALARLGHHSRAVLFFSRAVRRNPDLSSARKNLNTLLHELGR
jgi:tetratricopeptide (TPR) repeat protein